METPGRFCVREEEVRAGERCFQQGVRLFFVRCANFDGKTQISVDIGGGECHNQNSSLSRSVKYLTTDPFAGTTGRRNT